MLVLIHASILPPALNGPAVGFYKPPTYLLLLLKDQPIQFTQKTNKQKAIEPNPQEHLFSLSSALTRWQGETGKLLMVIQQVIRCRSKAIYLLMVLYPRDFLLANSDQILNVCERK